jgi:hypothetical protein
LICHCNSKDLLAVAINSSNHPPEYTVQPPALQGMRGQIAAALRRFAVLLARQAARAAVCDNAADLPSIPRADDGP